jgi:hypothetical protein
MTQDERIAAVAKHGKLTHRQAGFLVMVMVHSGLCVRRQYCTYAHIQHGQKVVDFFSALVTRRAATRYTAADGRARIFHVHGRALYAAIDEPHNRNRKPITLGRAIERLMLLDAVLAHPELRWLGTEREKVEYFRRRTRLREDEMPLLRFGAAPKQTVRYFPDKLPIGVTPDERSHLFLYLVTRDVPVDFRAFLHRHAELLRALAQWELRLLVPRHLDEAAPVFDTTAREELGMPLRLRDVEELGWYFKQRQRVERGEVEEDAARYRRAGRQFHSYRFRALYRQWKKGGDAFVHATVSRVLDDALTRRSGRIETHVLSRSYQQLGSLVGSA